MRISLKKGISARVINIHTLKPFDKDIIIKAAQETDLICTLEEHSIIGGFMIPLSVPNFEGNEVNYTNDAVSQGWVSTGGAYVGRLEEMLSSYTRSNAVACQSGTSALHMALYDSGITCGDIVIVPTLTFIAAVNPVTYLGAEPLFMDCDDSLCLDPIKLEEFCSVECEYDGKLLVHKKSRKKVRAIVVVHVFGNLADMEKIMDIASKYNLYVVEDATEALGSRFEYGRYKGKMAGTIGDYGALSFNGNKIITTGGGGAVLTADKDKALHIKYLSTQAKDDPHFYIHNEIGFNYRMTNVQAAIGCAQMEMLEEFIYRKNRNYDEYVELLKDFDKGYILPFRNNIRSNKWFYSLVIDKEKCSLNVKDYIEILGQEGVETRPIWGLIGEQKPYYNCVSYNVERARYYSDRIINLPCSTNITNEQIKEAVDKLKKCIKY